MEKTDSSLIVVCDAGPLIHLDELGSLDLLSDFSRILIPETIWQEVLRHRPSIALSTSFSFERTRPSRNHSGELAALGRLFTLHRGELDALQLCRQFANCLFLTDDMAARLAANQLGLPVHGTIGILLRAIRRLQGSREQVIDLLHILPTRSTLHLKLSLLEEIIAAVKSQE